MRCCYSYLTTEQNYYPISFLDLTLLTIYALVHGSPCRAGVRCLITNEVIRQRLSTFPREMTIPHLFSSVGIHISKHGYYCKINPGLFAWYTLFSNSISHWITNAWHVCFHKYLEMHSHVARSAPPGEAYQLGYCIYQPLAWRRISVKAPQVIGTQLFIL